MLHIFTLYSIYRIHHSRTVLNEQTATAFPNETLNVKAVANLAHPPLHASMVHNQQL